MIRHLISAMFIFCLLGSCNKTNVIEPVPAVETNLLFKDSHINVVEMKMKQKASSEVLFYFTTRYEVGIQKIEVLAGTTPQNLCVFFKSEPTGDSNAFKKYVALDDKAGPVYNYYMIRYTLQGGDWSYSTLYKIKMKN